MLSTIDFAVLTVYLIGVAALGIKLGGRQKSTSDYFLGGRDLPWWAVCFSVVATETSTLTVISVPAVAYGGSLTFLQITGGYIIGRIAVSLVFLPKYFSGNLVTAYAFLGERFGNGMRATASVTFLITRLLADGVRLFATAIPLKVIADAAGLTIFGDQIAYFDIILVLALVTIAYTLIGGIRAVVWMDVVQMLLYLGGGVLAVILLFRSVPADFWALAAEQGKTRIVDLGAGQSLSEWITQPYVFLTAVIGGTVFSMASHGTDQLIVQRLLACRNVKDGKKALITSGFVVAAQFGLFLLVGLLLWAHYDGSSVAELGLSRADEIFPMYILAEMPRGVAGLLLAGIIAAAMSTLSSSLNALASSTVMDLVEPATSVKLEDSRVLLISRCFTLIWGIVFIIFASLFENTQNPIVELGLAIASFTYGGLLGAFVLGVVSKRCEQSDAIIAFICSIGSMILIIFGLWFSTESGWHFTLQPSQELVAFGELRSVGWPWYTAIGAAIALTVGMLLGLRHRR